MEDHKTVYSRDIKLLTKMEYREFKKMRKGMGIKTPLDAEKVDLGEKFIAISVDDYKQYEALKNGSIVMIPKLAEEDK